MIVKFITYVQLHPRDNIIFFGKDLHHQRIKMGHFILSKAKALLNQ